MKARRLGLWLHLTTLGFTRALMASAHVLIAFALFALRLLQVYLVLLGKAHVPRELEVEPLRDLYLCDLGFLVLLLCHC